MSEAERVTVTVANGVADVRLNRPEKLNALDPAMFDAIVAAGERLAADRAGAGGGPLRGGAGVLRRAGRGDVPGRRRVGTGEASAASPAGVQAGRPPADALVGRLPGG